MCGDSQEFRGQDSGKAKMETLAGAFGQSYDGFGCPMSCFGVGALVSIYLRAYLKLCFVYKLSKKAILAFFSHFPYTETSLPLLHFFYFLFFFFLFLSHELEHSLGLGLARVAEDEDLWILLNSPGFEVGGIGLRELGFLVVGFWSWF